MARLLRAVVPGQPHLVVHRGHNGAAVFVDAQDAGFYLENLRASLKENGVALHAYALRAGEVRLLLTPSTANGLSGLMQAVGRRYVRVFNLRHSRTGTPWEGRFRSTVVEPEACLLACMRFVEAEPLPAPVQDVRPGSTATSAVTAEPAFFSSAESHLGRGFDPWLTEHPVFWTLGNTPFEREANYRRFLEQPPPEAETAAIQAAALKGWVLGSTEFAERVADVSGRRALPAPRGRPKRKAAA